MLGAIRNRALTDKKLIFVSFDESQFESLFRNPRASVGEIKNLESFEDSREQILCAGWRGHMIPESRGNVL